MQTVVRQLFVCRYPSCSKECRIAAEVKFAGERVASDTSDCAYPSTEIHFNLPEVRKWSPEKPNLYEVHFLLMQNDAVLDHVETYLSFREIDVRTDGLYINRKKYFQKLVLMQGIWEESGYTAPTVDSFEKDIRRAQEMGFNGGRMHMKFEDPRFLYAADRLGFLVWGETPSFYSFSEKSCSVFQKELTEILNRDKRHPSLIAWVIGNESWGIKDIGKSDRIRAWVNEIVALTRRIDPTRPVISNDGWEHLDSDIMTLHSYEHSAESLQDDWERARKNERCGIHRRVFSLCSKDMLKFPWVLSEFGAVSFIGETDQTEHWGYGDTAESTHAFLELFKYILETASALDGLSGWCYTQFSDVEKEKNGLLFADRTPKVEPSLIRKIIREIVNN
ncbi:MAG: glycoside hydrolase family 2 TIM barrel-domain containing protein [Spirochaetia bacterium]|nr:glycoside hydrolase family 2 TIM barrel-domain containing protein [Spirochaetia bacterium]